MTPGIALSLVHLLPVMRHVQARRQTPTSDAGCTWLLAEIGEGTGLAPGLRRTEVWSQSHAMPLSGAAARAKRQEGIPFGACRVPRLQW